MRKPALSYVLQTLAALLLVSGISQAENLASHPGFEEAGENGLPADWHNAPDVYQRDTEQAHSGGASLRFINADAGHYVTCSQGITLTPGRMYEVGVWVKTERIEGADTGAAICLEWSDAQGKYLGGCYPAGIKGTQDWSYVHGVSGRVPETAAHCSVSCYVRQGMTGKAWWDDVSITRALEEPLRTVLAYPNYRATCSKDDAERVRVRAEVNLADYELKPEQTTLTWKVLDGTQTAAEGGQNAVETGMNEMGIPLTALSPGEYIIEITLRKKDNGETLCTKQHKVKRVETYGPRTAYIDEYNRLIVNDKPFYPLGMYWGSIDAEQLEVFADSPFNCLMPYSSPNQEQMDLCQAKGLKVIYSVKDFYFGMQYCPKSIGSAEEADALVRQRAMEFRDHPALLAWYINDELGLEWLPQLTARQQLMQTLDPGHPTWVVLYQVDQAGQYLPTFDAIGTDPYPIPQSPASNAGEYTRKTVRGVAGARPVWQVPQVFNWACYRTTEEEKRQCRPPTLDEIRSMTWQCIAEGANGIVYYSWFDIRRDPSTPFETQWGFVKQVAQEVKEYIPALLSVEKYPLIAIVSAPDVSWRVQQLGETTYLFVVNAANEAREAVFQLPNTPQRVEANDGAGAESGGAPMLRVSLAPLGVKIVRIAGLAP